MDEGYAGGCGGNHFLRWAEVGHWDFEDGVFAAVAEAERHELQLASRQEEREFCVGWEFGQGEADGLKIGVLCEGGVDRAGGVAGGVDEQLDVGGACGGDFRFEDEGAGRNFDGFEVSDAFGVFDETPVADDGHAAADEQEEGGGFEDVFSAGVVKEDEINGEDDQPEHERKVAPGEEAALEVAKRHADRAHWKEVDVGARVEGGFLVGEKFPAVLRREKLETGADLEFVGGKIADLFFAAVDDAEAGELQFAGGIGRIDEDFADGGVG